jgi:hypothetical protein
MRLRLPRSMYAGIEIEMNQRVLGTTARRRKLVRALEEALERVLRSPVEGGEMVGGAKKKR